jgi:predicted MFS family arabinose efflux permease
MSESATTMSQPVAAASNLSRSSVYRFYVLGILTVVGVFNWMDRQLFAILLEPIKHDLRLTDTQLGLLGGIAFGLFYAAVGLPLARYADHSNRRRLLVFALALWSGMTTLCGACSSFTTMFLARMGVGIGEAGGAPTSQSMLSDYFPPHVRGVTMGTFYTFVPIGYVFAYSMGGLLNETIGWRSAFLLFGVPGLLLAALIRFTVKEPRRGQSELREIEVVTAPPMVSALKAFARIPSLRHIPIAGALHGLGAFGAAVWVPAYFMRVHSMSSFAIGGRLALLMGTFGLAGALLGGFLSDRLSAGRHDSRWTMWVPAVFLLLSVPFLILAFTASQPALALSFYAVPVLCNHIVLGPIVSSMQTLAGIRRRATVAAFYLFFVNLISMGMGPLVIGVCSDFFHARFGDHALQYSIMTLTALTCTWAAVHLLLASRTITMDFRNALDGDSSASAARS